MVDALWIFENIINELDNDPEIYAQYLADQREKNWQKRHQYVYWLDNCGDRDYEGHYYCAGCDQEECGKRMEQRISGYYPEGYFIEEWDED